MSAGETHENDLEAFSGEFSNLPEDLPWAEGLDSSGLPLPIPDAAEQAVASGEVDASEFARALEEQYSLAAAVEGDQVVEEPGDVIDRALSGVDNSAVSSVGSTTISGKACDDAGHGALSPDSTLASVIATPSPASTPGQHSGKRGPRSRKSIPDHVPVTPHPLLVDVEAFGSEIENDEYLIERSVKEAETSKQVLRDELKVEQREQEAEAVRKGSAMTSTQKERSRSRRESSVTRRRADVYLKELEMIVRQVPQLQREIVALREERGDGPRRVLDLSSPTTNQVADGIGRIGLAKDSEEDGSTPKRDGAKAEEQVTGDTAGAAEETGDGGPSDGDSSNVLSHVTGS